MNLSVIIPAYNESENIRSTVLEMLSMAEKIREIKDTEVIVVDDHSSDKTFAAVVEIGDPRVRCIRLSRRSGSHTALRAGIRMASGEAVFCISADGQDDPACLGNMLVRWRNGANIVWALRRDRANESWYIRKPAEFFYKILFSLLSAKGSKIDLSRADFFLLGRTVVDAINACPERNTSLLGLIAWLGFNQDSVESERRERISGSSKWNFKSRFRLAKDWI
ncbi:MAG: glycosyltransferase family 2 protein, partial [Candidatus Omnitrophota bacterium]|nr:glycosyltransferase family 2 protein [Candidatus Omnitrophota bacterium]